MIVIYNAQLFKSIALKLYKNLLKNKHEKSISLFSAVSLIAGCGKSPNDGNTVNTAVENEGREDALTSPLTSEPVPAPEPNGTVPALPDSVEPSYWISWYLCFPMVNVGNNRIANCALNFIASVALAVIGYILHGCVKLKDEIIYSAPINLNIVKLTSEQISEQGYKSCCFNFEKTTSFIRR